MLNYPANIIKEAYKKHIAVGAFNIFNLETAKAVIQAAKETNSPVIIQTSEAEAAFAGIENIAALVESMSGEIETTVVLNFDHGKKIESLERAVNAGYNSVMVDASDLLFEENIAKTKKIVQMAHNQNVWVEAELGVVPTPSKDQEIEEDFLTDVEEAKRFVEETKIDALAVAIGNKHGFYKGDSKINLERLRELRNALDIPLVLHGGSGIPEEDIGRAIHLGISKINVNTELRLEYVEQLRKSLESREIRKPHEIMGEVAEAVKREVVNKILLFNK